MAFGQYGSALLDSNSAVLVPPAGMCITAIQFLSDTSFDKLLSKNPSRFFNTTATIAHAANLASVTAVTGSRFIDLAAYTPDETSVGRYIVNAALGFEGDFLGKIVGFGEDANGNPDASFVELDRAVTLTSGATVYVISSNQGAGGTSLATQNVFPKGLTIYGRWSAVSLAADDSTGGAIAYFGPDQDHPSKGSSI